jgi:hypothetical protein
MPLSKRPGARARSLANLRKGETRPVGNANARSHGGYAVIAERELDEKVAEVYRAISADAPVRGPDGALPREDSLAVMQLAESLCRLQRITSHLIAKGIERDDGSVRPAVELEMRVRGHVLELLKEMGLTPRARAALGVDLVKVATAGDRLQEHLATHYGDDASEEHREADVAGSAGEPADAVEGAGDGSDSGTGAS